MKIILPWPNKGLSPNARVHHHALARLKKAARSDAWALTLEQLDAEARWRIAEGEGLIPMRVAFYPPDKQHRDSDNAEASFKAARDGIADALKVNDRRFAPEYSHNEPAKPGRIEVEFP